MKYKRLLKLAIITIATILAFSAIWSYETSGVSCCHHSTVHAQDDSQEGEGNPGHKEPTQSCSHSPDNKQVACKCTRQCDGAVENESRACKSYCFRHFCLCKNPPCV